MAPAQLHYGSYHRDEPVCQGLLRRSTAVYCPDGVKIVQVGIIGTGILEILVGLLIMRIGKAALDKVLPPVITGSVAIVIGIALAGAALGWPAANWTVAFITLIVTILFSVYLQGKGLDWHAADLAGRYSSAGWCCDPLRIGRFWDHR